MRKENVVKFSDVGCINFRIVRQNLFDDSPFNKFDFLYQTFSYVVCRLAG